MQKSIVLVGLMGAGKSTIGRQLAKRYKMTFYDSDKVIEERTGVSISTIFEIEGEAGFRLRESRVIEELVTLPGIVLATGGGSVLSAENRQLIQSVGVVIYLRASVEQLYARISYDPNRPLMQTESPRQTLRYLLKKREAYYLEVADIVLPTGRQRVSHIVRLIARQLKQLQVFPHAKA